MGGELTDADVAKELGSCAVCHAAFTVEDGEGGIVGRTRYPGEWFHTECLVHRVEAELAASRRRIAELTSVVVGQEMRATELETTLASREAALREIAGMVREGKMAGNSEALMMRDRAAQEVGRATQKREGE